MPKTSHFCILEMPTARVADLRACIIANEINFTPTENGWARRLLKWFRVKKLFFEDAEFNPENYVEYLRTLARTNHKLEVNNFVYLLELNNVFVNKYEVRRWTYVAPRRVENPEIPSREAIKNSILAADTFTGLVIMFKYCSGRRHADLKRLESRNCSVIDNEVHIYLNYCKTSKNISAYFFSFTNDLGIPMEPYYQEFAQLLSSRTHPFSSFDFNKLRKQVTYSLKGLRSARAIHHALAGMSADEICEKVGWECLSTMRIYLRLPVSSIVKLGSYDLVAQKLNNLC